MLCILYGFYLQISATSFIKKDFLFRALNYLQYTANTRISDIQAFSSKWQNFPITSIISTNLLNNCNVKGSRHIRLTTDCLENEEASTFHNPVCLHGLLQGQLYYVYSYVHPVCDTSTSRHQQLHPSFSLMQAPLQQRLTEFVVL